jgi:hypothetical protein
MAAIALRWTGSESTQSASGLSIESFFRLVKRPGVQDADHGLVGKHCNKLDLPLGEESYAPARPYDHTLRVIRRRVAMTVSSSESVNSSAETKRIDCDALIACNRFAGTVHHNETPQARRMPIVRRRSIFKN